MDGLPILNECIEPQLRRGEISPVAALRLIAVFRELDETVWETD
jgi:hypothetical protein